MQQHLKNSLTVFVVLSISRLPIELVNEGIELLVIFSRSQREDPSSLIRGDVIENKREKSAGARFSLFLLKVLSKKKPEFTANHLIMMIIGGDES
jgi:hypothetical protein